MQRTEFELGLEKPRAEMCMNRIHALVMSVTGGPRFNEAKLSAMI